MNKEINRSQTATNILNQLYTIGTDILNRLDLPPGSYFASDIHRALTKKYGASYLRRDDGDRIFTQSSSDDEKFNFNRSYGHRLEAEGIKLTVPTRHIFKTIMCWEQSEGLKAKDKHIWIKESPHARVYSTEVVFPSKSLAGQIPALMSSATKRNSECIVFIPTEGKLLGVADKDYLCFNYDCLIQGDEELPKVAFKLKASCMKQIYGRCTVTYYQGSIGSYTLTITNERGWQTSVNACLSEHEMKTVSKMLVVQEKDVPIESLYQSKWYADDRDRNPSEESYNAGEDSESEQMKMVLTTDELTSPLSRDEIDSAVSEFEPSKDSEIPSLTSYVPQRQFSSETNRMVQPCNPLLTLSGLITPVHPHEDDVKRHEEFIRRKEQQSIEYSVKNLQFCNNDSRK